MKDFTLKGFFTGFTLLVIEFGSEWSLYRLTKHNSDLLTYFRVISKGLAISRFFLFPCGLLIGGLQSEYQIVEI